MAMRLALLVGVALVAATLGCGGGNKAGGSADHPVVLTIANHETGGRDLEEYIAAVKRLSGGSVTLQQRPGWRAQDVDYDRGTLADVSARRVDLAKVGARSLDTVGVPEFEAVVAPFLVDDLTLQQRVLASGVPGEMLPAVRRLGVEGVAMLPGAMRRPFGLTRRLLGPADYDGAVIGVRPARVTALTFRALGGTALAYAPRDLPPWRYDGAELDPSTLEGNHYDLHGSALTTNVAYWPRLYAVVANPKVFASLSDRQRDALRRAGREALRPAIVRLRSEDAGEMAILCRRDNMSFVRASPSQLAALRATVRPVYATLARNATTRALLAEIAALKRGSPHDAPLACPLHLQVRAQAASALDGTWETTLTTKTLVAETNDPDAGVDAGRYRLRLHRGRVEFSHLSPGAWTSTGRYVSVGGDEIVARFGDGTTQRLRWNVYRDALTLHFVGPETGGGLIARAPWHRVRR
jgi:TRAP-type C4-dicarboxylate transport system substrate-binding protein